MALLRSSGNLCAGLGGVLIAALTAGCSAFPLQPYSKLVHDSNDRTLALQRGQPPNHGLDQSGVTAKATSFRERQPNTSTLARAALLPGRSQAEIKTRLEALWHPSLRPSCLPNYSGLLATRYSQLDTKPGPIFQPGTITVKHLGQDTEVLYIGAFHPGKRLPLVVGVSGINGTVDGKITVDILQSLYDTGDFHVVHLESVTSVAHQVRNQRPFAGGFPEGLLLYQAVAELRSQPDLADKIEQVHMLGVSFGGMLCGIAAHFEEKFQGGVIDGAVLAFSPPLDLKTLFDNIAALPIIHDRIHESYLESGWDQLVRFTNPELADRNPKKLDFDPYMRTIGFPYVQKIYRELQLELPDLKPIRTPEDAYALSSMKPFLNDLQVPYFYLYAYDDPVLSPEDHFHKMLAECPNPLVDGLLLKDGGHLGFDAVCGYPFTSQVAEAYFRYWSANPTMDRIHHPVTAR